MAHGIPFALTLNYAWKIILINSNIMKKFLTLVQFFDNHRCRPLLLQLKEQPLQQTPPTLARIHYLASKTVHNVHNIHWFLLDAKSNKVIGPQN